MVKEEFINITGVPTKVLTLNGELHHEPDELILVIPGNPGVSGFYKDFIKGLSESLDKACPVWVIGHAGHEVPEELELRKKVPSFKEKPHLLNLKGQINHKIAFIEQYVPKDCNLTLVGHSIGCKMSLETMRHFKAMGSGREITAFMFFPTIERMKQTPSGKAAWIHIAYLVWFWSFVAWLINNIFPKSWIERIAEWNYGKDQVTPCFSPAVSSMIHPTVIRNFMSLAHDELSTINELNYEELEEVLDKMRFYFGTTDGWCPMSYVEDMKTKLGDNIDAHICTEGIEHAFVIKGSHKMADIASNWHKEKQGRDLE